MKASTLQHLGHEPGRARRLVGGVPATRERSRRGRAASTLGAVQACGTTGVVAVPAIAHVTNDTTPAGAMWLTTSFKGTARHLAPRST